MTSVSPTACLPHRASRTSNWELRNRESVLPFLRLKRREPNQGVSRRSNVSQHDDSGLAYRGSLLTVRVQTASAGLKARMPATPTRRLLYRRWEPQGREFLRPLCGSPPQATALLLATTSAYRETWTTGENRTCVGVHMVRYQRPTREGKGAERERKKARSRRTGGARRSFEAKGV